MRWFWVTPIFFFQSLVLHFLAVPITVLTALYVSTVYR